MGVDVSLLLSGFHPYRIGRCGPGFKCHGVLRNFFLSPLLTPSSFCSLLVEDHLMCPRLFSPALLPHFTVRLFLFPLFHLISPFTSVHILRISLSFRKMTRRLALPSISPHPLFIRPAPLDIRTVS